MLHLPSVLGACLLIKITFASIAASNSGWHEMPSYETTNLGFSGHNLNVHQDFSSFGYSSFGNGGDLHVRLDQGFKGGNVQHTIAQAIPISEHIEVTKPVAIPVIKNIGVPVVQPMTIPVPHPMAIAIAQPYPVHMPVVQPVAMPVVKTIAIPVEKKIPYPIEKIIPVPVEKPVPITIEKHVPVPVEKPYPIHIPVYKHVYHRKTKKHGRKWRH
ncbi:zinc finger protein 512B-like isoform X1 [Pogonomyrmex barbatus]|uniref:Zinc finger protein 512B-like isoform X1 n=1 Tax=Pogonomyrmex barbatus TaxID=144034 RepID=A0A6I9WA98_9HYME|nr:zinc finger protein 512B-like isoform X1 [Pogonomyrmex barbatus]